MARAKTKEDIFAPVDPVQELQEFEIEQFFNEVAPGVSIIHFHRMYPDGRRPQIGKATLDVIREDVYEFVRATYVPKYGGGKYLMIARGDGSRYMGARMIEVDGMPDGTPTNGPAGVSNHGTAPEEKLPFHDRLLLFSMIKPQTPAIDIGALMAGMAAMMTAIRPAEAKTTDPMEMFKNMMTLYESMKKKEEKDPLTQLREVAGVIKEFSGDGKGEDSMWGAITSIGKEVVEKAAPILNTVAARGAAPAPPAPVVRVLPRGPAAPMIPAGAVPGQPAPGMPGLPEGTVIAGGPVAPGGPTPGPAAPAPGSQPLPDAEENLRKWLTIQIGILKQKARAGKDPDFWVDYFFENEEEPGSQAVLYAIRQGATLENLMAFDPEIGQDVQLTAWFAEVYNGVRAGLFQSPVDSGGQSRNPLDNSPNAVVSAPGSNGSGNPGASAVLPDTDIH